MKCVGLWFVLLTLALAGCAGSSKTTAVDGDPAIAGRKLYVAKCARCHRLYDPGKYSDAEWRQWMVKMSRKARLKTGQEDLLARYVATLRTPATNSVRNTPVPHL
jgi:hypothetical protein